MTSNPDRFAKCPVALIDAVPTIGSTVLAVYLVLADHANGNGKCWPKQETIADRLGKSVRQVRRALMALEAAGFIEAKRTKGASVVTIKTGHQCPMEQEPTNKNQLTSGKSRCDVPLPDCLNFPDFQSAWREWLDYRRERKLTLTARTLTGQLKKLSTVPDRAVSIIGDSIANGWQSVCYPSQTENKNGKHRKPGRGQRHASDPNQPAGIM